MPDWLLGSISLVALLGFIGYAFRQGMKVKLDRNNRNVGPSNDGLGLTDGSQGGSDGHSGF